MYRSFFRKNLYSKVRSWQCARAYKWHFLRCSFHCYIQSILIMRSDNTATTCALFSSKMSSPWPLCTMTYGQWKIHGPVVNTNLQKRWENTSLASSLPITLTDGAVMGLNWCMHISSNLISCLKRERESGSTCGNNDIILCVHLVTQPNQASRTECF